MKGYPFLAQCFFEVIYHQEIVMDPHIEICVFENLSYSKWLLSGNSVCASDVIYLRLNCREQKSLQLTLIFVPQ